MRLEKSLKRFCARVVVVSAVLAIGVPALAVDGGKGSHGEKPPAPASPRPGVPHTEAAPAPVPVAEPALPVVVPSGRESKETPAPPAGVGLVDGVLAEPRDVGTVPVLQHLAASGAKLIELGEAHGLRGLVARHANEFMFFQMAPDGEAVVAGLQADFPVSTLLTVAGSHVTELGTAHGLRGLFVRDGAQFQVFYATPDGERLIPGVMWDASGKNITREQVARVPGAVPSVVIGAGASAEPGVTEGGKKPFLDLVGKTSFGVFGLNSAPRVWMFVDPLCSYSVRALQEVRPFVERGQVQVAVIPVSVLDYETQGQSTPAALALLSKPPASLVDAWMRGDVRSPALPEAQGLLRRNMEVAGAIALRGTPTVIWRKGDGSEGRDDGVPDWQAVIASLGVAHAGR